MRLYTRSFYMIELKLLIHMTFGYSNLRTDLEQTDRKSLFISKDRNLAISSRSFEELMSHIARFSTNNKSRQS